ncbi:MAG: HAMP domain-containing histidine kinase [Tannerella sp.]|jgi:two-component system phosphate regulon sensor histidine kinase PhoR|nr:HAMP domain-containing histidine kinase [Tannerella sp.]
MKIKISNKIIWALFIAVIAGLVVLQAVWLYNSYQSKTQDLHKQIQDILEVSIKDEVSNRLNQAKSKRADAYQVVWYKEDGPKEIEQSDSIILNTEEVFEAGFYQSILNIGYLKFQIDTLDSLFHNELQKAEINATYNICYRDSNGIILEQSGDSLLLNDETAFRSDAMLIVNGQRVQVTADIAVPFVIRRMINILILSVLLIITIGVIAYLLTKRLLNEQKLNQFRNDFVNAFTHNMKTPLGQVLTTLENINGKKYGERPDLLEKHTNLAFLSVYKIQRQIEQMLAISKSEADSLPLNREDTDMQALMEGLKARFDVSGTKPVSIETSCNPEHLIARIDRQLMEDVISNLLDNAIKYSGESVKIVMDCSVKGNNLIFKVIDNGLGISDEDRKKIFEKYERGAAFARPDGAKGFGLGLNYVQKVVSAHGGNVQLFSTLGQGSEFRIILPEAPL